MIVASSDSAMSKEWVWQQTTDYFCNEIIYETGNN